MKLQPNIKVSIEKTIGSGLPTLLAINLRLIEGELPDKEERIVSDVDSLTKIRELFGNDDLIVNPKSNGNIEVKVKGGIIVLSS